MSADHLSLLLVTTIRHDGRGGVTDDLADPAGLTRWVRAHSAALGASAAAAAAHRTGRAADGDAVATGPAPGGPEDVPEDGRADGFVPDGFVPDGLAADGFAPEEFVADAAVLAAVVDVRTAVRALFARAVLPAPPSAADAGRLPSGRQALDRLNAAAARVPVAPRLDWPRDGSPTAHDTAVGGPTPADRLAAALARSAIAFLAGPQRELLRACPAPRCVRYFLKEHPRQEWCKPSCGNRARVARHHARRRGGPAGTAH